MPIASQTNIGKCAIDSPTPTQNNKPIDLIGEVPQLFAVMLAIGMQPISTATGNIGFGIAVVASLLRAPFLWRQWASVLNERWFQFLMAWLVWAWITLLWSPDVAFGIHQYKATRVLLWIPILWPLRHRWGHLVAAILVGTTIMVLIQASQMAFAWPISKFGIGAGLTTPTQTGLWAAISLSFWLIFIVIAGWQRALISLPLAVLAATGLVWSATRASVFGVMVELVIANIVLAITSKGWFNRAIIRCVVGVVILGGVLLIVPSTLKVKFEQAVVETKTAMRGDVPTTAEIRLAMWKMTLIGWKEKPIFGYGIGGIPSIAKNTAVTNPDTDMKTVTMIHSTYLSTLAETGLIGLGLLTTFIALFFMQAFQAVRENPVRVSAFGAAVVWFTAAAFDGYQQSGGFLSVGAIVMVLAVARVPAMVGSEIRN